MAKLALLSFAASTALAQSLGCLNGDGKASDFWYAFKYPRTWDYAYMATSEKLNKASDTLDADSSPVSQTLSQLYKSHSSLSYVMWNDESPAGNTGASLKSVQHAHAKGVLAFDGSKGFWLTHSLPKFPATTSTGGPDYAGAAITYGQSYLCINIDKNAMSVLNDVLSVDWLGIYDSADNAKLGSEFTDWAVANTADKSKKTVVQQLTSVGGQKFTVFGKSSQWDDALYDSLVAPYFKEALYTETWQNGAHKIRMNSTCDLDYKIQNIATVKFPGEDWKESQDHSKWAVAQSGAVFCVGDINRQTTQASRGGGTVCTDDKEFTQQMLDLIGSVEPCSDSSQDRVEFV